MSFVLGEFVPFCVYGLYVLVSDTGLQLQTEDTDDAQILMSSAPSTVHGTRWATSNACWVKV